MRPGTRRKQQRKRQSSISPPPFAPFPDLDHQIAGIDIDNGTFFFSQFCRIGYKVYIWFVFVMDFWIIYQNVCFLNFRYLLLFCFFRLQISLKILILVWVLLFLILTKSLGLNKYRVECCIDIYFSFFCCIPITSKFFFFFFPNMGIKYDLGLNFLVELLYPCQT